MFLTRGHLSYCNLNQFAAAFQPAARVRGFRPIHPTFAAPAALPPWLTDLLRVQPPRCHAPPQTRGGPPVQMYPLRVPRAPSDFGPAGFVAQNQHEFLMLMPRCPGGPQTFTSRYPCDPRVGMRPSQRYQPYSTAWQSRQPTPTRMAPLSGAPVSLAAAAATHAATRAQASPALAAAATASDGSPSPRLSAVPPAPATEAAASIEDCTGVGCHALQHGLSFRSVYRHFDVDGIPEITTCTR
jgi:hypothetical protein